MYRGLLDEAEDNMNCILRVREAQACQLWINAPHILA